MVKINNFFLLGSFVLPSILANTPASIRALISQSKYTKAHSLGENYRFDPRDGWQSINVTDLRYKYRRTLSFDPIKSERVEERSKKSTKKLSKANSGLGETITKVVANVWKGLKAIGKPQTVEITWYTGHDLQNPSCWAQGTWAPTDESFACATTLNGWKDKPQCLKFLELCNTPKKCVFARVVDSCAGCAPGSRHIDLTRAAFGRLADFDEGTLNVQYRASTDPDEWHENLWGPKDAS